MNPITLKLLLPVGISFYTFQTLSYTIDVYREKIKPEKENFSEDEFMSRVWELYNSLKHSIETREMGLTEIAKITEDFPELSRFIEDKDEDKDENLHEKILNFLTHKLNNEKQKRMTAK